MLVSILGNPSKKEWPEGYEKAEQMGLGKYFKNKAMEHSLEDYCKEASDEALHLMSIMLSVNPNEWPTASECMTHVFFMAPKEPEKRGKIKKKWNLLITEFGSEDSFTRLSDEKTKDN